MVVKKITVSDQGLEQINSGALFNSELLVFWLHKNVLKTDYPSMSS